MPRKPRLYRVAFTASAAYQMDVKATTKADAIMQARIAWANNPNSATVRHALPARGHTAVLAYDEAPGEFAPHAFPDNDN